jgi:hypothetical protein
MVTVNAGDDDRYNSNNSSGRTVMINIETLRLQLSGFVARIQSRVSVDTIRPLPVFLGLNAGAGFCLSPQAFTPPVRKFDKNTPEKIKSRVRLNCAYFLSNYALLAAMTGLVVALMHPTMVFFVGIVYGLWSLHSFLIRNQLVVFGVAIHALLNVQQRFYLLFVITSLVVIIYCLAPTLVFLVISGLLILTHALLRDPQDVSSASDQFGGVVGAGGSAHDSDEDLEGGGNSSGGSSGSEVVVDRPAGGVNNNNNNSNIGGVSRRERKK